MLFKVAIEFTDGWKTIMPKVDAKDHNEVSETILREHGDNLPAIVRITVISGSATGLNPDPTLPDLR